MKNGALGEIRSDLGSRGPRRYFPKVFMTPLTFCDQIRRLQLQEPSQRLVVIDNDKTIFRTFAIDAIVKRV
jgi:hypothetical protein